MGRDEFEELYQRYYRPLFLYAYALTRSTEDAEDLVADAFVKVLTAFPGGNIRAWLYKVLRNQFFDLKRKQKREQDWDTGVDGACTEDVLQLYIKSEERQWLYRQINALPEREREVMLLTIQTDYGDQEIGDILGLTVSHVRVLRHRAKGRIIKQSEEEGI